MIQKLVNGHPLNKERLNINFVDRETPIDDKILNTSSNVNLAAWGEEIDNENFEPESNHESFDKDNKPKIVKQPKCKYSKCKEIAVSKCMYKSKLQILLKWEPCGLNLCQEHLDKHLREGDCF